MKTKISEIINNITDISDLPKCMRMYTFSVYDIDTIQKCIDEKFSKSQIKQIADGLDHNLNVICYFNKHFSAMDMKKIKNNLICRKNDKSKNIYDGIYLTIEYDDHIVRMPITKWAECLNSTEEDIISLIN